MPWNRMDVSEQRVQFVVRARSGEEAMSGLCREFGISRTAGYKWLRRYLRMGSTQALAEESRRPQYSPRKTPPEWEERVEQLRRRHGWGARKLQVLLEREGVRLPAITIHRILRRRGLIEPEESPAPAVRRFERSAPNQLWQMDGKGEYRLPDGICYPLSLLDDYSRYAVGLYALRELASEAVQGCVVESLQQYGVPEAMLMDHGSPWWSTTNGHGLTRLSVALMQQGIRLIYGRIRHPQTQGKVERFHRTLAEAVRHRRTPQRWAAWPGLLAEFRQEYNEVRPHEALGMQPPARRYQPSRRAYCAQPPAWEYPRGSRVEKLNSQGCLEWEGRRWFVCEALAREWVRVELLDRLALVSYRHMYIRELDLSSGRTTALLFSREG